MVRKKMLLIAYLFPPIGGGGVQRALKMAKYLGRFGVDVSVLTVKDPSFASLDESLLEQVPDDVKIYRAQELKIRRPAAAVSAPSNSAGVLAESSSWKQKLVKAVKPALKKVKEMVLIPDDQILWYSQAVKLGVEIVKRENIDIIFSTSGPYTNHLVGKAIKAKTGVRWIADYRDPWTQNMHRPAQKWRCGLEEKMERSVMEQADIITTVTHSFAENFKAKYPTEMKKLVVIHNGFDPEDYVSLEPEKLFPEKWTFVYTGIFYKERNPRLFLQCAAELIEEGKLNREDISLQFAGIFDYPGYDENKTCVQEYGLEDIVHLWGNLPHKRALGLLAGADQLLLIGDISEDSGAYIPGKLFEYMAVQKPIFALTVDGESARIISAQGLGKVIAPFDKTAIKHELQQAYESWKTGKTVRIDAGNTIRYQRDEQARELAEVIMQEEASK